MELKDVWEAASALGTCAAVIVALVFSYRALADSRRIEKDRSDLAAARLLGPVSSLEEQVSLLYACLVFNDDDYENSAPQISELLGEIESAASTITTDDLYQVLGLPGHAAKRLARALGLIHIFCRQTKYRLSQARWSESALTVKREAYKRWAGSVSDIRDHLQIATRQLDSVAATGAPRPSSEEMYGSGD